MERMKTVTYEGVELLEVCAVNTSRVKTVRTWRDGDRQYTELSGLTRHMRRDADGCLAAYGTFTRHGRNVVYDTAWRYGDEEYSESELWSEVDDAIRMLENNDVTEWF